MKLSFFQKLQIASGNKADLTSHFQATSEASVFTQKAVSVGIKFYCKNYQPPDSIAAYDRDKQVIYINGLYLDNNSLSLQDDTILDLIIEHESVHPDQDIIHSAMYDGDSRIYTFQPLSYFPITQLDEAEAYGFEVLKGYKDYRLSADFRPIHALNKLIGSYLPQQIRTDIHKEDIVRKNLDRIISSVTDDDTLVKNIIIDFAANKQFAQTHNDADIEQLAGFIKNDARTNAFAAHMRYNIHDPKDLFVKTFTPADLETHMNLGERSYYDAMNQKEKALFVRSIFDLSHIGKAPYQALVKKTRAFAT
jgi:hypothetical protein